MASNEATENEIIGYAEPWIVSPGDNVAIKVQFLLLKSHSLV